MSTNQIVIKCHSLSNDQKLCQTGVTVGDRVGVADGDVLGEVVGVVDGLADGDAVGLLLGLTKKQKKQGNFCSLKI